MLSMISIMSSIVSSLSSIVSRMDSIVERSLSVTVRTHLHGEARKVCAANNDLQAYGIPSDSETKTVYIAGGGKMVAN